METTLTQLQFEQFISRCTISYEGDSYGSKGKMMDPEGNEYIASINYDNDSTEVIDEVYIDEDFFFIPNDSQHAYILEEIDRQTASDRGCVLDLRKQPSSKYELYGVNELDFIS